MNATPPLRRRSKVYTLFEDDYTPLGQRIANNLDADLAKLIDSQKREISEAVQRT